MIEKAYNTIILILRDKVLRQVSKEKTTISVWSKLEDIVLTEQMDMFNKLIFDIENIKVNINDEDQALLLLCDLPKSHAHFKENLL